MLKGLILAGGRGTRLRPITYTRAKQLVPVANKPILFYGVEALRDAGVRDIGVIVGDTADDIMAALGDGSRLGVSVTYIPQSAPLGLAHAVAISEEFMAGEPFVMYLGDNLIKDGITPFVRGFEREACEAQILLARVPNANQFGVAELAGDGSVTRLVEKPAVPRSDLALVGVYMFDRSIFPAVHAIEPSARGELEITDAIQWLIDSGMRVRPHVIEGWWKDTGKLSDMLEANRIMLDVIEARHDSAPGEGSEVHGRVRIGRDTTIVGSVVRGPAVIGDGCEIRDSYVGPYTSVHDGCAIVASEIEHSIVLTDGRVEDAGRLCDSLIGCGARVRRAEGKPASHRLMIGDRSEVEIV